MWGLFFLAAAAVAVMLFAPGFVLLRAFNVARPLAVGFAPAFGVAAYVVVGLAYSKANVACSWASVVIPVFVACCVAWAFGASRRRKAGVAAPIRFGLGERGAAGVPSGARFDALCLAAYLLFGVVFASVVFCWALASPDHYAQEYDNISHLGSIQSFVTSGVWSPFASSLYSTAADVAINPLPGGGFYPTAWYTVAALACSAFGVTSAMAENVANLVFVALVYPAGMFALLRVVFDARPSVVPFGAVCCLAFSGFPWMLLVFGPLYPNMSAFCMVPAAAAVFLLIFGVKCPARQRAGLVAWLLVSLCALALAQPNAVFTLAVLLAPFLVWKASRIPLLANASGARRVALRVACALVAAGCIAGIWMALYHAPFLRSVVEHEWVLLHSYRDAVIKGLGMGFMADGSQLALSLAVAAGVVLSARRPRYLWLTGAFALAFVIFVVDVSTNDEIQHILGGFWYTDMWRCAAMASLFAVPLCALGLWGVSRGLLLLARRVCAGALPSAVPACVSGVVCAALLLAAVFPGVSAPGSATGQSAFRVVANVLQNNLNVESVYDAAEKGFVQKVRQTVDSGDLVINVPDDGSAFAYVADGLRTYYRYTREYDVAKETAESRVIRAGLCNIASDENVLTAVRAIGAKYVLQLDQGEPEVSSPHLFTYEMGEKWRGIDAIRDDTPGFEVVLSEGDMRLYKIADAE